MATATLDQQTLDSRPVAAEAGPLAWLQAGGIPGTLRTTGDALPAWTPSEFVMGDYDEDDEDDDFFDDDSGEGEADDAEEDDDFLDDEEEDDLDDDEGSDDDDDDL